MLFIELTPFTLAGQGASFWVPVAILFGMLMGSFFNVVIHRLPRMQLGHRGSNERYGTLSNRSSCPHCGHAIRWYENIPVISYVALRGRCSGCHSRISLRYPLIEIATGAMAGIPLLLLGPSWHALVVTLIGWVLLVAEMTAGEREKLMSSNAMDGYR